MDEAAALRLQEQLNTNLTLCKILTQRGVRSFQEAKDFFVPQLERLHDPFLMKDMRKAVDRISRAISSREKILVFGDYDVDGTTSVSLMYGFLSGVYETAFMGYYIPHRYREGYGVSKQGIDHAHQNGFSLIICLDCGIKSVELVDYARSLGIDFVICDHHLPGEIIPAAVAVLDPKQADCEYPFKELCGCGVGFKLISALAIEMNIRQAEVLRFLDLVATAIAADIVDMTGENRVLAWHGLKKINEDPCPGIKALAQLGGVTEKEMRISHVVFVIAPRVNAAGRMDEAGKAVKLFIEQDKDEALKHAEVLHHDNSERKEADSSITEHALMLLREMADCESRKTSVVYHEEWHKGVVGIVASRLIEHYHRPTIVLTGKDEFVSGSARSVSGFNLYEAVYACRDLLVAFGGHVAAAGLTMKKENLKSFTELFEQTVAETCPDELLIPEIKIDSEINFSDITKGFYHNLCRMEPFGPGNMKPVFVARRCRDSGYSKVLKEKHLRIVLSQSDIVMNGIGFNMADKFALLQNNSPVDIVFCIDESEWNGFANLQLKLIDIRASAA